MNKDDLPKLPSLDELIARAEKEQRNEEKTGKLPLNELIDQLKEHYPETHKRLDQTSKTSERSKIVNIIYQFRCEYIVQKIIEDCGTINELESAANVSFYESKIELFLSPEQHTQNFDVGCSFFSYGKCGLTKKPCHYLMLANEKLRDGHLT